MLNSYRFNFTCRCPSNPETVDKYKATIDSSKLLPVEDIWSFIARLTDEPMYQEDLTRELSDYFRADVSLTGEHQGIEIFSECLAAETAFYMMTERAKRPPAPAPAP